MGDITSSIDIVLNILKGKDQSTKTGLEKLQTSLSKNNAVSQLGEDLSRVGITVSKTGNQFFKAGQQGSISWDDAAKSVSQLRNNVAAGGKAYNAMFGPSATNNILRQAESTKKLEKATAKAASKTQFWSMNMLSFLFVGQQIEAAFMRLANSSTTAFQQIAGETNKANQTLLELGIGFTAIKATIGEAIGTALEPLIGTIMNIISATIDFISEHQNLVAWLILGGVVFGWVMAQIGQFALMLNSVINLFKIFGPKIGTVIEGMGGWSAALASIGITVLWVVAIVMLLWAIWNTNLGNIKDAVSATFGSVWETIKNVFKGIWEIVKGVFTLLEGIFSGDWRKILTGFLEIFIGAARVFMNLVWGFIEVLYNAFNWGLNTIKDLFFNLLFKAPLDILKSLISAFNDFFGTDISTAWADKALKGIEKIKGAATFTYSDGTARQQMNDNMDAWVAGLNQWVNASSTTQPVSNNAGLQTNDSFLSGLSNPTQINNEVNITNQISALSDKGIVDTINKTMDKSLSSIKAALPTSFGKATGA